MPIQPFSRPHDEESLYKKGVQIGFDGSLVGDRMTVYVLALRRVNPYGVATAYIRGIRKVDYFHGLINGIPMAQMYSDKAAVSAIEMINISRGFTALRIANFQRRWRLRRQIPEPPPFRKMKKAEKQISLRFFDTN